MKEHKFQRLNITDTESIKAIGELLNADYIISGKITTLGNISLLTVQMIDVVTGQLETGSKYHISGCYYLKKSSIAITIDEAIEKYEPYSLCD